MKKNNLPFKLVPPNYFFTFLLLAAGITIIFPNTPKLPIFFATLGLGFIISGITLNIWSTSLFKKHKTPHKYKTPNTLVTIGPFQFSRNPMYLGMLIVLTGFCLIFNNLLSFISPIFFFFTINNKFIPYEEKIMQQTFGKKYTEYKKQTRRWI